MMFPSSVTGLMAGAVLAGGIAAGAQAGSLMVTPILVTLDDKTHSAALTVKNEGSEVCVIQTELLRWTQKDGTNVHTPSGDILVNPPVATLQPGQTQIVRIGLKRKADNTQELAYRLFVTEVPPPSETFTGLRVALRLGVPVYVSPRAAPITRLAWQAARAPNGNLLLTALNDGNRHLRLDSVKFTDPGTGRVLGATQPAPFTLLAGQARRYSLALPPGWQGRQLNVLANTAEGAAEARVDLPGPAG